MSTLNQINILTGKDLGLGFDYETLGYDLDDSECEEVCQPDESECEEVEEFVETETALEAPVMRPTQPCQKSAEIKTVNQSTEKKHSIVHRFYYKCILGLLSCFI